MEAKEKAEQAWIDKIDRETFKGQWPSTLPSGLVNSNFSKDVSIKILFDYKASLREAIEERHKAIDSELDNNTIEKQAALESLDKVLELLDTVNPKN